MPTLQIKNKLPFVSIIVPVLNSEETIQRCLFALREQTYPEKRYKLIVVDNGSTDRTIEMVKKFPVVLLSEKRAHNSYMARNCGLKHAKGEIVAFVDADCIADKNWLISLIVPFHDERVGVVVGEVLSDRPRNLVQGFYEYSGFLKQEKKVKNKIAALGAGNIALREKIFDIVGTFDENFRWGGDNDFGIRIQKETNYLIQFSEDARVYHCHRTSLKSLVKHAYTYGLGKGRFTIKYSNNIRENDVFNAFCTLLRLIAGIPAIPVHSCRIFTSGKTASESFVYPILDKLFCIVDQVGKILFLIKQEDIFFRNS